MAVGWVDTTRDATSVLVTVGGELDQMICPQLRDALLDSCRSELPVAVEMSEVTFLDSSVLGVLAATARRLSESDRTLAIRNPSARALTVLRISGMLSLFDVTPPPTMVPRQASQSAGPPLVIDLSNGATRRGASTT